MDILMWIVAYILAGALTGLVIGRFTNAGDRGDPEILIAGAFCFLWPVLALLVIFVTLVRAGIYLKERSEIKS